jgi:subtilisin family serine protease
VKEWNVDIISVSFALTPPDARQDTNMQLEESELKEYEESINDVIKSINHAIKSSRLIFAAASNDGKNRRRTFPANYPSVFGVYASDGMGAVSAINPFSQEDDINIMTLGIDVKVLERRRMDSNGVSTLIREPKYRSGTSFATAIAAGIAGTILDIADRAKEIEEQTKEKLRDYGSMRKIFTELLPRDKDNHCYLTPWHLFGKSWEADQSKQRTQLERINRILKYHVEV